MNISAHLFIGLLIYYVGICNAAEKELVEKGTGISTRPKRVLAIFAYKQELPWAYRLEESMRDKIARDAPFPIELNVEYADRARFPEKSYLQRVVDFYQYKYSGEGFDLIIAIGDESAEVVVEYGESMFGTIPRIILWNDPESQLRESLGPNTLSMRWGWEMGSTVELIQKLLPETETIYFISGTSASDLGIRKAAMRDLAKMNVDLNISFITDFATQDMLEQVSRLPDNSVIYFLSVIRDKNQDYFVSRDLVYVVSEKANVPVFGMAGTFLGQGIVGGRLLSPEYQGERIIDTAVKVLKEESVEGIIVPDEGNQIMFDWRQLKRWSINENLLPDGSIIEYRNLSTWDIHKGKIIIVAAIIGSQGLALFLLLIQGKRRSQAEIESQRLRDDLAHISRVMSMGEIASSLAHEINQPLAAIQSYAQAAQRFLKLEPPEYQEVKNSLGGVVEGSRRAKEVIRRIRMNVEKHPPQLTPIKAEELIQQVLVLVRGKLAEHHVELRLEVAHQLPQVYGDQIQLQQVLLNLVVNGIEAVCESEVESGKLIITAQNQEQGYVVISVKDNGIGIADNMLDQTFETFHSTKTTGLGIGLAISKSIIESHEGRLWFSRNDDRGVTFFFTIPQYKDGS